MSYRVILTMKQDYFDRHLSLSEWAIQANVLNKEGLIKEDASKRTRLDFLNKVIGLPVIKVYSFSYKDLSESTFSFLSFVENAGNKLYALRMTPKEDGLPVLRNRKQILKNLVDWALSSDIDHNKYDYRFELHVDPEISAIFIVSDGRVIGEAIHGSILQLNKGLHREESSVYFQYDFAKWRFSEDSALIRDFLQKALQYISVQDSNKRLIIENDLNAVFSGVYLEGYFEAITSEQSGVVFIDYNRILVKNIHNLELFNEGEHEKEDVIRGQTGCSGKVKGKARVILQEESYNINLTANEILICHFTLPEYVPLIIKAAAVVTDVGGILSHAAIVCRELKKPCVIGTKVATQLIKNGDIIEVDADRGVVRVLESHNLSFS
jgi:phosphohistidine swiveling domain-containing protein